MTTAAPSTNTTVAAVSCVARTPEQAQCWSPFRNRRWSKAKSRTKSGLKPGTGSQAKPETTSGAKSQPMSGASFGTGCKRKRGRETSPAPSGSSRSPIAWRGRPRRQPVRPWLATGRRRNPRRRCPPAAGPPVSRLPARSGSNEHHRIVVCRRDSAAGRRIPRACGGGPGAGQVGLGPAGGGMAGRRHRVPRRARTAPRGGCNRARPRARLASRPLAQDTDAPLAARAAGGRGGLDGPAAGLHRHAHRDRQDRSRLVDHGPNRRLDVGGLPGPRPDVPVAPPHPRRPRLRRRDHRRQRLPRLAGLGDDLRQRSASTWSGSATGSSWWCSTSVTTCRAKSAATPPGCRPRPAAGPDGHAPTLGRPPDGPRLADRAGGL